MGAISVADYAAYVDYLEVHPEEFAELFNTILINVTSFFRDPTAWERLRATALTPILSALGQGNGEGCARGARAARRARSRTRSR